MGKKVSAEIIDVDQYQRAVAVIRYAGRDINREMVAEGMAWAYRRYLQGPYASEYLDAENRARARRAGLWRDANPRPPGNSARRPTAAGAPAGTPLTARKRSPDCKSRPDGL